MCFMKTKPSALAPFLRSDVQGALLGELYADPSREHTISTLATAVGTSPTTAMREVDRLVEAGYLNDRHIGRSRMVCVNTEHPLYQPISQIVRHSYGALPVLSNLLSGIQGIREALVYGSWAARSVGIPGRDPHDVDVLVVGSIRPRAAARIAAEATDRLGKEVNIHVASIGEWHDRRGFLADVAEKPMVRIDLHHESEVAA